MTEYKIELGFSCLTNKDEILKKKYSCGDYYLENHFLVLVKSNTKIYIHTSELDYFIVGEVEE